MSMHGRSALLGLMLFVCFWLDRKFSSKNLFGVADFFICHLDTICS